MNRISGLPKTGSASGVKTAADGVVLLHIIPLGGTGVRVRGELEEYKSVSSIRF